MPNKPISCVVLWVEGEIPEDYDWEEALPAGLELTEADGGGKAHRVRTFPWKDVHHEVQWWITRPMTMDEWIRMDDAESKALGEILGDDFMGTAGPIPFPEKEAEVVSGGERGECR